MQTEPLSCHCPCLADGVKENSFKQVVVSLESLRDPVWDCTKRYWRQKEGELHLPLDDVHTQARDHEFFTRKTRGQVEVDGICNQLKHQNESATRDGEEIEFPALFNRINACTKQKDLCKGSRIHADVLQRGLLKDNTFVGTALVRMYATCGALSKAQELFDELAIRDVVSWTTLIGGYAQHGLADSALNCLGQMCSEGLLPNEVTYACVLKVCASIRIAKKGEEIHDEIGRRGLLGKSIVLGNALVDMYAKCGVLTKAQEVFDDLPVRNVASWTSLICGYAQHGLGNEALGCFEQMQDEGVLPDAVTILCLIKACSSVGAIERGEQIHTAASKQGLLERNVTIGTALVDMYARCGSIAKAQEVFTDLQVQNVASWNVLIAGYVQQGLDDEALTCFTQMQDEHESPNAASFVCVLKACSNIGAIEKGEEVHACICKRGLLQNSIVLGNALIDMYGKCGVLAKAQELLDELPTRNVVSWTALITGYSQHGLGSEALRCFRQMQCEGFCPDVVTFVCILKACSSIRSAKRGKEIHAEVIRLGLLGESVALSTALVDMYAKSGSVAKAQEVFDVLPTKDVALWNALISGYAEHGYGYEALIYFEQMQGKGLSPDVATYASILQACGTLGEIKQGEEIHANTSKHGLLEKNVVLGTALVDMYVKCGMLAKAQEVFNELPVRDVASWTTFIAGYVQSGHIVEALDYFEIMQAEGISPDAVTFVCILNGCGSMGAVEKGKKLHVEVSMLGLFCKSSVLGCALVDMYAKCGALEEAEGVFEELLIRDVVCWTALMAGYAQLGDANKIFDAFKRMVCESIQPNAVTFIVLLNACSHVGLMEEGQLYLYTMYATYHIMPDLEHFTCIIELFSRVGDFDKAMSVIKIVALTNSLLLWLALLGSCWKWVNVEVGKWVFGHTVKLDEKFSPVYVCMRNLYRAAGMQQAAEKVETYMQTWKLLA